MTTASPISTGTLPAIAWRYTAASDVRLWAWQTPHFRAAITRDREGPFAWEVAAAATASHEFNRVLADGLGASFPEAEQAIRETIGKSFPRSAGYRDFAGHLATTFTLADNLRHDLGVFHGRNATVEVSVPGGVTQTLYGTLEIRHYEVVLVQVSGEAVAIQPAHIHSVSEEGGHTTAVRNTSRAAGRLKEGVVVPGCTGTSGFLANTVDHSGLTCPIHEEHVPEYHAPSSGGRHAAPIA